MTQKLGLFYLLIILFLVACAPPQSLPSGPTPIPTLIPATDVSSSLIATEMPTFAILSYPAGLPSAELGQSLYQNQCDSCHGDDGNGVVPGARNFGDLDYMRGETPASFYSTIIEGRGEMPAFRDTMSSDEIWDLVFYVWRFSTNAETLALGQHLYDGNCQACHGIDGTGEVLGAADFSDLRFVDDQAPRDFYLITTQGKGSMPAWQGRLSQDERWAVIDYVRTFSYDPSLPGETPALPPPTAVAEDFVCDSKYLTQTNPFDWNDSAANIAGQVIYDQACVMCHGVDGSGGFPDAPDYTNSAIADEFRANSAEKLCIVADGKNSMPGWKETLTDQQMWEVLTYIYSLAK
ncbi:MAG TPA: c-type cytochrome [Anaerolineales bacterium]|nr:c-type cytochrome [Anaerolineales bacterium]